MCDNFRSVRRDVAQADTATHANLVVFLPEPAPVRGGQR